MSCLSDAQRLRHPRADGIAGQAQLTDPRGTPVVVVTAAVIEREGVFLVTRRPDGVHLAGCWEFPGGKCEPGETLAACLQREILEELETTTRVGAEIFSIAHAYPDRVVELHFFRCELAGEPRPVLGQEMRWVARKELALLAFPPADEQLIQLLTNGG
jgi:8-oxo-dGTP diphosphatase